MLMFTLRSMRHSAWSSAFFTLSPRISGWLHVAALIVMMVGCRSSASGGASGGGSGSGTPQLIHDAAPLTTLAQPRLPRAPGPFAPSLVAVAPYANEPGSPSPGDMLSDTESCASCHPQASSHWAASAHSFASFGNPIYRANIELVRSQLGKEASRHCGGCHDMPLVVDGLLTATDAVPSADLRAHSGVTCRLCHGIQSATSDGNASYVWSEKALAAPDLDDVASIAKHKAEVSVTQLGDEICVSCHRGFLSPDMGMPAHLFGIDEPTAHRSSAYTGNGAMRMDNVQKQSCVSCHMAKVDSLKDELGAKQGKFSSHRFLGGHTWMAAMRGDKEHLEKTQANLVGVASIDIGAARIVAKGASGLGSWRFPWNAIQLDQVKRLEFDVVIRNLLVGHRFPGGVLDMHDTWVEVTASDDKGKSIVASGVAHATDAADEEAHVLRSLIADEHGTVLNLHEIPSFRALVVNHTIAPREAVAVRYGWDIAALPPGVVTIRARLLHRSRLLIEQKNVCDQSKSKVGKSFLHGAKGARLVELDPCAPQPITEIASTTLALQTGDDVVKSQIPWWQRAYEHGMALTNVVSERLQESFDVLSLARERTPTGKEGDKARAMIDVQLGWVYAKQGRVDEALKVIASVEQAAKANNWPLPPVLQAVRVEALSRVWRWQEAIAPAQAWVKQAPRNTAAWVNLARVLASAGDDRGALAAAADGLAISPRDPDLLRSQSVALHALKLPKATEALDAFERFRTPDTAAEVRINCASKHAHCAREREITHTHELLPLAPLASVR